MLELRFLPATFLCLSHRRDPKWYRLALCAEERLAVWSVEAVRKRLLALLLTDQPSPVCIRNMICIRPVDGRPFAADAPKGIYKSR